ncbi:MAG: amidophosphoribosyltransferase [Candidatus Koribacter versatilis]|uniref:Amidophosphoribosyltransferase n=1 Tax=Candidatus Korobacter versatilis TaxID=658062 RepID=A0A932A9F2_9BACT|nr:amidophosphoribosyltransferase [Candidatus Koribacter versatilis]
MNFSGLSEKDDKFHDECGVVAIYAHPEASKLAYLGLHMLQHRGQESAGIVSSDGVTLHAHKAMGHVAEIFTQDVLARLAGPLAIGHTRYSTSGDSALLNAQPIMVDCNKGMIALAHNGNLVNAHVIRQKLEQQGSIFQTTSDTEVIVHLVAQSKEQTLPEAIADALRRIEGAFSLVLMTRDRVFAVRDPRGFRPLSMGRIKAERAQQTDTIVFASETCAFDLIGATYERDVSPGEMIVVGPEGVSSRFYHSTAQPQSACIFEHVYFSRPDSIVFGRSVQESREQLGRQLAKETGVEADIVVPVPDSGVVAATGYSEQSGIPLRLGLIRNHYVGRTFIEPSQRVRDFGVRLKLNPVRSLLAGKRVILIDDSIVRGTTSRKIVRMVREAGAKEVHMRISCPPTISPCFYGVDTPSKSQLIAANKSIEEIREYIGADSLAYLSHEGMKEACGEGERVTYCSACYTGKYPTAFIDVAELEASAKKC